MGIKAGWEHLTGQEKTPFEKMIVVLIPAKRGDPAWEKKTSRR
jgi:hypothetical protein